MKIYNQLEALPSNQQLTAFTLGNFDGVHIGHQFLIKKLCMAAKERDAQAVALTFSNHPSWVLHPEQKKPLICSIEQKVELLASLGLDALVCIPFKHSLSKLGPEDFLNQIQAKLNLCYCLFGSEASFGYQRSGTPERILKFAKKNGITLEYLNKLPKASSTEIRNLIKKGSLQQASALLGRPYSLRGLVIQGKGLGRKLGFPTLNICCENLCLPPLGVYLSQTVINGKSYPSLSNLGTAPTVSEAKTPQLESYLLTAAPFEEAQTIDVQLKEYLRPEKRFASQEALSMQIQKDVRQAKAAFNLVPS